MGWGDELDIRGADVEDFLDASAGIKHRGEQCVITAPVARGAIDRQQGGLDLVVLEVFDDARGAALEGDREDALTLLEMLGMDARDKPEEGVNGGQSDIPGRGPVAAGLLTVVQKGHDDVGRQGIEIQLGNRSTGMCRPEPQQEREAVSITADGVGTGATDLRKVLGKNRRARTRAS